jgi:hypothetical protein
MKIFPETSFMYPITSTLEDLTKVITISSHNPIFSNSNTTNYILDSLKLHKSSVKLTNPHIKILNSPITLIKTVGSLTVFS